MEVFKRSGRSVLLLQGVCCYWTFVSLLAGLTSLNMAGPITEASGNTSTSHNEGSGHGSLLDFLGITDDDDEDGRGTTDEYSNGLEEFDEDDADWGRGGSFIIKDMALEDSTNAFGSLDVRCFRCHGDGVNGCDVLAMLQDAQTFSVMCFGKCLNLSSGSTSVYDCANDMQTKTDICLKNGDTEMCFCTGDFCNGPSEVDEHNQSHKTPFFFDKHSLPLDKSLDQGLSHRHQDTNYESTDVGDKSANLPNGAMNRSTSGGFLPNGAMNMSTSGGFLPNGAMNRSTSGGFGRKTHKNLSGFSENRHKAEIKRIDNVSKLREHKLSSETSTNTQKELFQHFPHIIKSEIDVSISETVFRRSNNLTSKEGSPNSNHVNELRVGNFVDRGKLKNSVSETVPTCVLVSVCSVFITVLVL